MHTFLARLRKFLKTKTTGLASIRDMTLSRSPSSAATFLYSIFFVQSEPKMIAGVFFFLFVA